MKTIWENDFGEEFETQEEARENVYERMELDDYLTRISDIIDVDKLLRWAWGKADFFETFDEEVLDAERRFFEDNYHECVVEDEEKEEDEEEDE